MSSTGIESIHRLTPLQEGILFHCLNAPDASASPYNVQFSGRYDNLDPERFTRAWEHTVARHAALRSLISWERRSKPLQIVRRRIALPLHLEDWRGVDGVEQERRWRSFLARDRAQTLVLDRSPLFRLALLRIAERRYRFTWSIHHVLVDGWSMHIVLNDVAEAYAQLGRGESLEDTPAGTPADYVAWLDRRDASADVPFWQQQLAGFTAPVVLPRAPDAHGRGHQSVVLPLTPTLTNTLREVSRTQRITLNTLVLGAWALVLAQRARTTDVVVGTTVSGRLTAPPGIAGTVGMFLNSLPLRVQVDRDTATSDWLRGIQRQQVQMRAHEATPLTTIQRTSALPPGVPLFDAVVAFNNRSLLGHADAGGPLPCHDQHVVDTSHYPMALVATEGDALTLHLVHDAAVFSTRYVDELARQVHTVLAAFAQGLDGTLTDVPLLTAQQLRQVTATFNDTHEELGEPVCVHTLIREHARTTPEALAVVDDTTSLTYRELHRRSRALAAWLVQHGVEDGVVVPLLATRSTAAIVGIVAILEAGGTYLPLDPNWPAERLEQLLSSIATSARLSVVLCDDDSRERLPAGSWSVISLDRHDTWRDGIAPDTRTDPASSAYAIFTSGSTGVPKAVLVSHASLFNSTRARSRVYPEPPGVFLLLSALATDSSVAGLFWTLCAGGTLVLPPRRAEQDPAGLWDRVRTHRVTHTLCLPSLYTTLLAFAEPEALGTLKVVAVAGEPCTAAVIRAHHDTLPGVALFNEYGPSEACVWASVAHLDTAAAPRPGPISIGHPIANTRVYIVDEALQPVAVDTPGELLIAGPNLALGYLGQPELTAERFPTLRIHGEGPQRVYRSGDLACWRDDGTLEFLGRIDRQVKIRGHRVELDEIESTLADAPGVAECAVALLRADGPHDEHGALASLLETMPHAELLCVLGEVEGLADAELDARLGAARFGGTTA